jgi:imidazolonepropionase-like amidohydrolase
MNRLLLFTLLLGNLAFFQPTTQPTQTGITNVPIAIVGATIIDGTGAAPRQADVLMRGERIEAVGSGLTLPPNARIIKAEGMTLLPGLFDLHTHLPYASTGGQAGDWAKNLKAYLYCGVTSVTEFGTYPETFEPMRRLLKTGTVAGPRIHFAARMTTPHGHGAEGGRGDFFSLEVTTPREARAAVNRLLPYQPDAIKVFTDGWRYNTAPDMTSMNEDTLAAIVEEAHKHGIEVLTHTVTLEKAKIAARAGVDVIAHGIGNAPADEELIGLMKAKGTTYASTLAVYEPRERDILSPLLAAVLEPSALAFTRPPLTAPATPGFHTLKVTEDLIKAAPPREAARLRRWQHLQHNVAALHKAGIRLGNGTDAGVTGTHHGWATLRELQLNVASGLSPLEALTIATGNSAKALRVDHERGFIAPGQMADLLLIAGAPHRDINDLEKIQSIFLGGRELDRARLAREIAAPGITALPANQAQERLDDFESADGRSLVDTLWVNSTDAGIDASHMIYGRLWRAANNHALSVTGKLAEKDRPYLRINLPLSQGAVEPVDARAFRGIRFDARGAGDYSLIVPTANVRDFAHYQASFKAGAQWQTITLDFAALKQANPRTPTPWTGTDLLMLSFEIARPAGAFGWLELDNVAFYR